MKIRITFFAFLFLATSSLNAQINLVTNPSFEDYTSCPDLQNQVSYAVGWIGQGDTPDYFNSCSPSIYFSVPFNWGGYQEAATGQAYCGIGTYGDYYPNIRDLIQTQLTSPLTIGETYYVSFKANLGISTEIYANCANDLIGMLFTTFPYSYDATTEILPNYSQVYTTEIITDTLGWTTIQGSFIADSAYEFITLGNFFDDLTIDTTVLVYDPWFNFSYYFIDDVCVSTDSLDCFVSASGISSISSFANLSIFPNPTSDYIAINFPEFKNSFYGNVIGIDGTEELQFKIDSENTLIDLRNLNPGIYYINIFQESEKITKKIIITQN